MLSRVGRETLVKVVLQAIPAFIFSCFLIPNTLLNKMESIIERFWWTVRVEKKMIHWVSKEKMTRGKAEGGLGFRNFEFNLSFLAKLRWRIVLNTKAL
ncbi:Putative ribonuclease H protein At1g65750 [Linum perenne]